MTWPEVFEQRLAGELPATPPKRGGRTAANATSSSSSSSPGALVVSARPHHRSKDKHRSSASTAPSTDLSLLLGRQGTAAAATLSAATLWLSARLGCEAYKGLRRRALRSLLLGVCPRLDSLDIPYFVDFGTLLGLHRERDVILHDNDADVVLLDPDFDALLPRLRQALTPQGFRVCEVVPSEDATVRWLRVIAGPLGAPLGIMDLYGGWRSACTKRIEIPQGHGDLCDVDAHLVLPTGRMRWRGASLACPRDVEGVLVHRYGATWRTPRYMDKGRDEVEQGKPYVKVLTALGRVGLRI
jgi:hypothetical protein